MNKTNHKTLKVLSILLIFNFLLLTSFCFSQSGAAINTSGTAADASAMLDVSSVNSGILIPRMDKAQRNAIGSPAEGLMIYQINDTTGFWFYDGTKWKLLGSDAGAGLAPGSNAGNTLYWDGTNWVDSPNVYNNGGSVGIGTNSPDASALIDLSSTTKGTLITRMTTSQRNAISNPAEGLQIFNTTTNCFEFFSSNSWQIISCDFICGVDKIFDRRDGNTYQTVQIGSQCWMKENLKYLPVVHNNSEFSSNAVNLLPGYGVCDYDGNIVETAKSQSNYAIYGVLYNWYALMDGSSSSNNIPSGVRGVCPIGWHIPSDNEWKQLEMFLGMSQSLSDAINWRGIDEGSQLKDISIWASGSNTGASNSSGFKALPGGSRSASGGTFAGSIILGYWFSSTEDDSKAWRRLIGDSGSQVARNSGVKGGGASVRCLMD